MSHDYQLEEEAMTDRSPIAALLPKWKEWADSDERSARNAVADEPNEDWRNDERGIRAVWLRQACRELEAAIAAQVAEWERTVCGSRCIRDLKGEP